MQTQASHRFSDVTPRKMRPLAQLVRGKTVDEAVQLLRFLPNRGAKLITGVILSARGNAIDKGARDADDMILVDCRIDCGPTFKRIMPRARGTAFAILRRLSHISVVIVDADDIEVIEKPNKGRRHPVKAKPVKTAPATAPVAGDSPTPAPISGESTSV